MRGTYHKEGRADARSLKGQQYALGDAKRDGSIAPKAVSLGLRLGVRGKRTEQSRPAMNVRKSSIPHRSLRPGVQRVSGVEIRCECGQRVESPGSVAIPRTARLAYGKEDDGSISLARRGRAPRSTAFAYRANLAQRTVVRALDASPGIAKIALEVSMVASV